MINWNTQNGALVINKCTLLPISILNGTATIPAF